MANGWLTILALSLAITSVSATVSKAKISDSFRSFLLKWSDGKRSAVGTVIGGKRWRVWIYELVSCPYCFSHWLAIVGTIVYRPDVVPNGIAALDGFVSVFVIVTVANVVQNAIMPRRH